MYHIHCHFGCWNSFTSSGFRFRIWEKSLKFNIAFANNTTLMYCSIAFMLVITLVGFVNRIKTFYPHSMSECFLLEMKQGSHVCLAIDSIHRLIVSKNSECSIPKAKGLCA